MQIIIPMSGFGERFRKAGYTVPKPLIEIDGKPIIAHVIDLFPGETDFIFICNRDHLAEPSYRLEETIHLYCPTGRVVGIGSHKLGPVHAVLQVADLIDQRQPVVVNYADFTCYWNWRHFCHFVAHCKCDGAIPAYKGFHPHTLGATNYAYMREADGWVLDIQEKQPYTDNRMEEYASSGTYYFSSGQMMLDALQAARDRNLNVAGEFYVSLSYKPMLESGKRIAVYDLQHFMQWGTPEDVAEYRMWSDTFRRLIDPVYANVPRVSGTTLIPMAGLGERFTRESYVVTKPLIPVSGKPMVVQATADLPATARHVFVLRRDMPELDSIRNTLHETFPGTNCVILDGATDGQARTALLGLRAGLTVTENDGALTIAACDNGALYRHDNLQALLDDPDTDVIVWVVRGYPNAVRHPQMYGWVACEGRSDRVSRVSVKKPLADPKHDPIITGTFTFRRGSDFARAVERMIERDARVNGEFYVDTSIEDALALGLTVRIFEIDSYICWGTPNDLRTFEYWQSCFHKWEGHPYRLHLDKHVSSNVVSEVNQRLIKR
ncbi:MAG: sugar phosphate nucleotidyltransferase [Sulfuricaulis sp.]|uniref:NTP transferase domain-containing protein n=1 Tax=Sulfuricaulis sp. TaxID=2003553 RepID=UPI0034A3D311